MKEQIEDAFIHIIDQIDSIEDCANSIIEHITETRDDLLDLRDFIGKNVGNGRPEHQTVRHGKWKQTWGWNHDKDEPISISECSECKSRYEFEEIILGKPNYCPNCGARMDGSTK